MSSKAETPRLSSHFSSSLREEEKRGMRRHSNDAYLSQATLLIDEEVEKLDALHKERKRKVELLVVLKGKIQQKR